MSLEIAIRKKFLRRLLETPEGRAHVLNLMVNGEEADEAGVFDRLAALAEDESGRKAALRHKADEERHAALYRSCLARTGVRPRPVPDRLMLVRRIVRRSRDKFAAGVAAGNAEGIDSRQDLMNTYAMLLVIEQRALKQFPVLGALFRAAGDAKTADVFDRVANDERRHVKYCQAMGRRYAPDAATWERAVARYRAIEAEAYREIGLATIGDALTHDLLGFGRAGRTLGRLLCALDDRVSCAGRRFSEPPSAAAA
jgi:rubrerythrin